MVMKILNKIKHELPGMLDYIMFYNTGIVFQSTFSENTNVPEICSNLNDIIKMFKRSLAGYDQPANDFQKIIFETNKHIVIILKLGEDSNIALFFDNEVTDDVNINSVQRYLNKLQELIDMDKSELNSD